MNIVSKVIYRLELEKWCRQDLCAKLFAGSG